MMTLADINAWVQSNTGHKFIGSIMDELSLITQCERDKHNHFSIEGCREMFNEMPVQAKIDSMIACHIKAEKMGNPLDVGDVSSDRFFITYKEVIKDAIKMNRDLHGLPGVMESLDNDLKCEHDIQHEARIKCSIEYIMELMKKA